MADNINVKHDPTIDTVPVATDEQGTVHVPIYESLDLAIPQGKNIHTIFNKQILDKRLNFDTGDNEVTIWDGANDGGLDEMQYNYSSSAAINAISSSNNGGYPRLRDTGLRLLTGQ